MSSAAAAALLLQKQNADQDAHLAKLEQKRLAFEEERNRPRYPFRDSLTKQQLDQINSVKLDGPIVTLNTNDDGDTDLDFNPLEPTDMFGRKKPKIPRHWVTREEYQVAGLDPVEDDGIDRSHLAHGGLVQQQDLKNKQSNNMIQQQQQYDFKHNDGTQNLDIIPDDEDPNFLQKVLEGERIGVSNFTLDYYASKYKKVGYLEHRRREEEKQRKKEIQEKEEREAMELQLRSESQSDKKSSSLIVKSSDGSSDGSMKKPHPYLESINNGQKTKWFPGAAIPYLTDKQKNEVMSYLYGEIILKQKRSKWLKG